MKKFSDVVAWCVGAAEQYADPAEPVCQLFFRWQEDVLTPDSIGGEDLVCGWHDGKLVLMMGPSFPPLPVDVASGGLQLAENGALEAFGASLVTAGVWELVPSLNAPGLLHAFVVLYGVPDPAPWERRILTL